MSGPDRREHPRLWHHFDDVDTQQRSVRMGMWVFLASEVLLFAGLFCLYAAYRSTYREEFVAALSHNDALLGTTNTVVLLVSSFTMASAIALLRANSRRACLIALAATAGLGGLFLLIKAVEYSDHFHHGIYPGTAYSFAELPGHGAQLFFTLYYFMTGLHAIHMIVGLLLVSWMWLRVKRRRTTSDYHVELEVTGLYWHLVDSIWIFLWPMFYLLG